MKRLHTHSQNFIRSPAVVKTLLGHSDIGKEDIVYDIGAGSGVISSVLAEKCARVVAVEYDPRMVKKLHDNLSKYENVTIIQGDALNIVPPDGPYKIFANIPFHLSSPILRKLIESNKPPTSSYLIVQRQFANKLIIDSQSFTGLLGAMIAPYFTAKIRFRLKRTDFWPHPAIDTVLVELKHRSEPLLKESAKQDYFAFVEKSFSRQKYFASITKDDAKRPSQLTTDDWLALFQSVRNS